MSCVPLSMLGGPSTTGWDGVYFPVHMGCNSTDVSKAGVFDYVKECASFIM